MTNYQQIMQKSKEQNVDLEGKNILIPISENKFNLNDTIYFGRIFEDKDIVVVLHDVEDLYSDTGFIKEPFIYKLVNKYRTYLSNGTVLYLVEFYTVE